MNPERCDLYSGAIVLDRTWLRRLQARLHLAGAEVHSPIHLIEGGSKPRRYIYISISWGAGPALRLPYIYFGATILTKTGSSSQTWNWLPQPSFKYTKILIIYKYLNIQKQKSKIFVGYNSYLSSSSSLTCNWLHPPSFKYTKYGPKACFPIGEIRLSNRIVKQQIVRNVGARGS